MCKKPCFLSIFGGLILVLAGFLLGLSVATTEPIATQESINSPELASQKTVSILIDTGSDISGWQKLTLEPGDTVFSLLTRLDANQESLTVESQDFKDLGVMIKSINKVQNGQKGEYWQYWVNNQYATMAADKQPVLPGDVIMWKFTGSQFKEY